MGKLEGYKCVITGSTSGIGLGISKKFIEEGATVIGVGRDFHRTTELGDRYIPTRPTSTTSISSNPYLTSPRKNSTALSTYW